MRTSSIGVLLLAGAVTGTTAALRPPVPSGGGSPAPELTNTSWLNADHPLRLAELRGRVVLLNFWVFTCGNCTRTVPSLVAYDRQYRSRGLTIIGIHTPEFPPYAGEHDRSNVARARGPHQRSPEAGARAGRRDSRALRLTPPDCRLGLLRGGADGRYPTTRSPRHPAGEHLSVWRRNLPVAGDRRGVVRCTQ